MRDCFLCGVACIYICTGLLYDTTRIYIYRSSTGGGSRLGLGLIREPAFTCTTMQVCKTSLTMIESLGLQVAQCIHTSALLDSKPKVPVINNALISSLKGTPMRERKSHVPPFGPCDRTRLRPITVICLSLPRHEPVMCEYRD